ncbi:MAG TPA: methylated-DNA--[protein]-cysteine S-methyltransferase [Acidimicrobiales bacterium]|nr:methylated-DNA--[protein]-cysteine S-methyltransferase [Acidimicrobiales bacterium]
MPGDEPDDTAEVAARLRAATATGAARFDVAALAARAEADGLIDVAWARADSPIGSLVVAATPRGLVQISFRPADEALDELARKVSPRVLEAPGRLDDVRRQLDEYFAGRRHAFDLVLDRALSQGFRATVLAALEQVGWGTTVSYADLARAVGHERAFRAVGSAMATNPIPVVVPCHRVLRTGGDLGGYAGGLDAKRWLLAHEGVLLAP